MAATDPISCPACGAKLRAGRRRCLRCGELLVDESTPSARQAWFRAYGGRIYVGATILSVVILLVILIRLTAVPPVSNAEPSALIAETVRMTPSIGPAKRTNGAPAPDPSFVDSRRDGNLAYNAGNFDEALKRYEQAIAAHPSDAESLNNLGQVLVRTGRPAAAVPNFEKAIALNKTKWSYHFNLARALGQLENWPRAIAEYRAAAALFPDDYPTQYNLALALHKAGDEESAIAEFRKAVDLAPEEPTFHLSLAMSLEKLSRVTEAVESYERYLQLAPRGPAADRVRQRVQELKAPR